MCSVRAGVCPAKLSPNVTNHVNARNPKRKCVLMSDDGCVRVKRSFLFIPSEVEESLDKCTGVMVGIRVQIRDFWTPLDVTKPSCIRPNVNCPFSANAFFESTDPGCCPRLAIKCCALWRGRSPALARREGEAAIGRLLQQF